LLFYALRITIGGVHAPLYALLLLLLLLLHTSLFTIIMVAEKEQNKFTAKGPIIIIIIIIVNEYFKVTYRFLNKTSTPFSLVVIDTKMTV